MLMNNRVMTPHQVLMVLVNKILHIFMGPHLLSFFNNLGSPFVGSSTSLFNSHIRSQKRFSCMGIVAYALLVSYVAFSTSFGNVSSYAFSSKEKLRGRLREWATLMRGQPDTRTRDTRSFLPRPLIAAWDKWQLGRRCTWSDQPPVRIRSALTGHTNVEIQHWHDLHSWYLLDTHHFIWIASLN